MWARSRTASGHAPEGFIGARRARSEEPEGRCYEFRAPPGVHCYKLRVVGDHILWVNSERLAGDRGRNARAGIFIFDISKPDQPKEVGFYDTPGSGPHRFEVDNKRQLAFLPNDAPGWNKRVIWTLDVKNPLKPEVVGIWGLPWQKAVSEGEGGDPMPHEQAITLHGPPMIRGNRMYAAFWGGGIAIIDCTDLAKMELVGHLQWSPPFPGLDPHGTAGRRPTITDLHRRGERQPEIMGRPVHVGGRHPQGDQSDPGRHVLSRARQIFRPPRPFRRPQHPGKHPQRRPVGQHHLSHLLQRRPARRRRGDPLRPKEIGCFVP